MHVSKQYKAKDLVPVAKTKRRAAMEAGRRKEEVNSQWRTFYPRQRWSRSQRLLSTDRKTTMDTARPLVEHLRWMQGSRVNNKHLHSREFVWLDDDCVSKFSSCLPALLFLTSRIRKFWGGWLKLKILKLYSSPVSAECLVWPQQSA